MVVPCPVVPFVPAVHVVHRLLPGVKKAWPHGGRHVVHGVHHAVSAYPRTLVSTACHKAAGAVAIIGLGLLAPGPQAVVPLDLFSPIGQAITPSHQDNLTGGASVPESPAIMPALADFSPALTSFSPALTAPDIVAPSTDLPGAGADVPAGGSGSVNGAPNTPRSVAEPSSLMILAAAWWAAGLIRHRLVRS